MNYTAEDKSSISPDDFVFFYSDLPLSYKHTPSLSPAHLYVSLLPE